LQKSVDTADPDQQKIADLYASLMDEVALESVGLKPLDTELARVNDSKTRRKFPR